MHRVALAPSASRSELRQCGRMLGALAVDGALVSIGLFGIALVALGALHLWKTNRFFAFYTRFNEGKGPFQLPGGASEGATRLFRAALVGIGAMALIGAFTQWPRRRAHDECALDEKRGQARERPQDFTVGHEDWIGREGSLPTKRRRSASPRRSGVPPSSGPRVDEYYARTRIRHLRRSD